MTRHEQAARIYSAGMARVRSTPPPKGQKFPCGSRVRITKKLPPYMSHFTGGVDATVLYTYAHAYGGDEAKEYCLDVDGEGEISWYEEGQLTALPLNPKARHGKKSHATPKKQE